jgi:excisionase family DNA binding protein
MTASNGRRDRLMDITGVADRLGVSVRYVRRLVAERRIPYIKFGHLLRFEPKTIDDWLDKAPNRRGLASPPSPNPRLVTSGSCGAVSCSDPFANR